MVYKNCQSCGMPMTRDPGRGGTESDGSRSGMYCSHCYAGGKFTDPDMTLEQMTERVRGKMRQMGVPLFLGYFFTRSMPKLKRWAG